MQDQSNRDYTQPFNQLRPRSTASSGMELDEICPEIEQASGGLGLDHAIKLIDGKATTSEIPNAPGNPMDKVR